LIHVSLKRSAPLNDYDFTISKMQALRKHMRLSSVRKINIAGNEKRTKKNRVICGHEDETLNNFDAFKYFSHIVRVW